MQSGFRPCAEYAKQQVHFPALSFQHIGFWKIVKVKWGKLKADDVIFHKFVRQQETDLKQRHTFDFKQLSFRAGRQKPALPRRQNLRRRQNAVHFQAFSKSLNKKNDKSYVSKTLCTPIKFYRVSLISLPKKLPNASLQIKAFLIEIF